MFLVGYSIPIALAALSDTDRRRRARRPGLRLADPREIPPLTLHHWYRSDRLLVLSLHHPKDTDHPLGSGT